MGGGEIRATGANCSLSRSVPRVKLTRDKSERCRGGSGNGRGREPGGRVAARDARFRRLLRKFKMETLKRWFFLG